MLNKEEKKQVISWIKWRREWKAEVKRIDKMMIDSNKGEKE